MLKVEAWWWWIGEAQFVVDWLNWSKWKGWILLAAEPRTLHGR